MMKNTYIYFLCLFGFFSCNVQDKDAPEEDYHALFPKKEIEAPENAYEDMIIQSCDPNLGKQDYQYNGVLLPFEKEYEVTLTCRFIPAPHSLFETPTHQYEIRYVDADKRMKTIGSDTRVGNYNHIMQKNKDLVITYKAKSGFPMMLSVYGIASRGSGIIASIKAVSTDGLISVTSLKTEQYQNREGPNRISEPFCQYIILP